MAWYAFIRVRRSTRLRLVPAAAAESVSATLFSSCCGATGLIR